MEDYGLFEPVRAFFRSHLPAFSPELEGALTYVRERLAAEGPLASRSLELGTRVAGYWDEDVPKTKATSQALEHLWETGEVVVAGRRNDERFFALAVDWIGDVPGTDSWDPLLRKYLRAYGVADLGDFRSRWRRRSSSCRPWTMRSGTGSEVCSRWIVSPSNPASNRLPTALLGSGGPSTSWRGTSAPGT